MTGTGMTDAGGTGTGTTDAGATGAGVIRTRALTKRYGAVAAVSAVDLEVREGDRYGLLGPNGSGKTTMVRMLLGLVYATSGEIEVLGRRIPRHAREVLPQIGALIEEPAAYPHLSGRANLALLEAGGRPGAPGGAGWTRRWSRSAWAGWTAGRSRPTRWACASGWAWPAR
jgi:ABC-type sugar transport system ATPase subunit